MRFFEKYTGILRRIKPLYAINNWTQLGHLKANKTLYKKYKVSKPIWASISSKDFDNSKKEYASANVEWEERGILQLKGFFESSYVDDINAKIENAIERKEIDFNFTQRKILFAFEKVKELKSIINHQEIISQLETLVGDKVIPFQSINFVKGSEQRAHSDSVHMATYPNGGLIAIWVALDDIDVDNGPLFYYPGSHRLPYVTNKLIGNSTGWLLSENPNKNYEDFIAKEIEKRGLKKEVVSAKKGDIIIWHANLLHGGMPHLNPNKTRRSMVVHYFVKDRICYHELSQRPAIIKPL